MSRKVGDINAKIAYITNRKTGPILKVKRPLVLRESSARIRKKDEKRPCLDELTTLLKCTSLHEDNSKCSEAFAALLKCNQQHEEIRRTKLAELEKGKKVDGQYHPRVLSRMLAKYPEHRSKAAYVIQRNLLNAYPESRTQPIPYRDRGRPFNKRTS